MTALSPELPGRQQEIFAEVSESSASGAASASADRATGLAQSAGPSTPPPTPVTGVDGQPQRPSAFTHPRPRDAEGYQASGPGSVTRGEAGPLATPPQVLGLDLALTAVGVAPPDGQTYTVHTKASDGDRRLQAIANAIAHACDLGHEQWPDLVVIEDLPTHAHSAGITGMVHGAVRLGLLDAHIRYVLVPPASLKKFATGRGNATKADMRVELLKRAGLDLRDDNQVDAWWLRCMGLDHLGFPPVRMPAAHRKALDAVTWPEQVSR